MKLAQSKLLASCLTSILLFTSSIHATEEPIYPDSFNSFTAIEPLPPAEEAESENFPILKELQSRFPAFNYNGIPEYNYSSYGSHVLNTKAAYGYSIQLEDGSWWEISKSDANKVLGWANGDPLAIIPNTSWFSSHTYYLTNRDKGTYVKANLSVGPVAYGDFTHWIGSVDLNTGHVFLDNGSCWCISSSDSKVFREWAPNDTIIIGYNDSWFSSYNYILINVNMNNYLRAKQY